MNYNALIPVKSLGLAKSRLTHVLAPSAREKLILHMLKHTIEIVQQTQIFTNIFVASADQMILDFAKKQNATPLFIPLKNHNSDLKNAVSKTNLSSADKLLTISSDIPLLQKDDIKSLIALKDAEIVLAPSKEGSGTNALLCTPLLIPYLFGKNSLFKFQKAALQKNLSTALYNSPTIAFDLDTPSDLKTLLASNPSYSSFLNSN